MIFTIDSNTVDVPLRDVMADIAAAETDAGLQARDGMVYATPRFLQALAARLRARGIEATSTTAWQVWISATEQQERVRKETEESADIAFWYGIDPFGLGEDQRAGLLANLPRVQAQKTIHSGSYNATDYRFVYDLFMLATGNKALAERQRAHAMEALVDSQTRKG